jgi:beta-glucosidase
VVVLGISPTLEGEEMKVNVAGFRGGDRTDLNLPKAQEDLLKAVTATGKPTVLVLLNGSALAINWADENVPAIVDAWYPAKKAARLSPMCCSVTTIRAEDSRHLLQIRGGIAAFEDYNMQGRTYRYFKGQRSTHLASASATRSSDTRISN